MKQMHNIIYGIILGLSLALSAMPATKTITPVAAPLLVAATEVPPTAGAKDSVSTPAVFPESATGRGETGESDAYPKPPPTSLVAFNQPPPAQPPTSTVPVATAGQTYSACGPGGCGVSSGSRVGIFRRGLFGRRR